MGEKDEDIPQWALKSFLHPEMVLLYSTGKLPRTSSSQKGKIGPRGLRARFSGYRMKKCLFDDSKPKDPWPGFPRAVGCVITFADEQTGERCHILNKSYTLKTSIPITGDASVKSVSGILGIATESPETVESGEQRENELVMEYQFRVVVSSYTDDSNYLCEVFCKLAHESQNNETTELYLSHDDRIEEKRMGDEKIWLAD